MWNLIGLPDRAVLVRISAGHERRHRGIGPRRRGHRRRAIEVVEERRRLGVDRVGAEGVHDHKDDVFRLLGDGRIRRQVPAAEGVVGSDQSPAVIQPLSGVPKRRREAVGQRGSGAPNKTHR